MHVHALSLIQHRGSLLLQPDGAISQEPDGEHLFSWCHPRCRALTHGETNNLASLPLTQLCEPAGGALVLFEREGGRSPACCTGREIEARPCSPQTFGKWKIVCFMNVWGSLSTSGISSTVPPPLHLWAFNSGMCAGCLATFECSAAGRLRAL